MVDSMELIDRLGLARQELEDAYATLGAAWGSSEPWKARPQAVQLEARIGVGELYCREHPDSVHAKRRLYALRRAYTVALADPADQRRCDVWYEAFERFQDCERRYLVLNRLAQRQAVAA